jgi:3-phytase
MLRYVPSKSALVLLALAVVVAGALAASAPASINHKRPPTLEFRGQAILPTGTMFAGTQVGGLSGIQYAGHSTFFSLSDDPSQFGPARFYKLRADIRDGRLTPGDITFLDVTTLKQPDGTLFPTASLDPEGFALTPDRKVVVTSEGFATRGIDPWIRLFRLDGSHYKSLPVPDQFLLGPGKGVRQNLGFESAAVTKHGKQLWTGSENALAQDGPPATLTDRSPARLLRYKLKKNQPDRQYLYFTDPIAEPPVPATNFAVSGLVDILPLDNKSMLTMERSFSVGAPGTGNKIKLFRVDLKGADDISRFSSLAGLFGDIDAVQKTLLLNLDVLGLPLDNVEGMTFGPTLRDGRRTLLLVSDNNFAATQFTQFLLFAYSG